MSKILIESKQLVQKYKETKYYDDFKIEWIKGVSVTDDFDEEVTFENCKKYFNTDESFARYLLIQVVEENKKLREALEFYADESKWGMNEFGGRDFAPDEDYDEKQSVAGKIARKVLAEIKENEK